MTRRTRLYPTVSRDRRHLERPWVLEADLAYDGGGSEWRQGYRTRWGARIAAFFHVHFFSWGGTIDLIDNRRKT